MAGFNIRIGVGISVDTPIEKRLRGETSPSILDALLMEDGTLLLMEDGTYFQLESGASSASEIGESRSYNDNYWKENLLLL